MDTSKRFLVVDDFATMRKIIINMLIKLGFSEITEADSGKSAWTLLQRQHFDLIISDFNMPGMNGVELLEKVRQDRSLSRHKFIMLTAEDDEDLILESKKLHVDAYILKPFKIDVIEAKLKALFAD